MKEVFVVTSEIETRYGLRHTVEGVKSTFELAKDLLKIVNSNPQVSHVMIESFLVDEEY